MPGRQPNFVNFRFRAINNFERTGIMIRQFWGSSRVCQRKKIKLVPPQRIAAERSQEVFFKTWEKLQIRQF